MTLPVEHIVDLVELYREYSEEISKLPVSAENHSLRDFFAWLEFKKLPRLHEMEEERIEMT